jgi:two-component system, OmpR family, sensor kinase
VSSLKGASDALVRTDTQIPYDLLAKKNEELIAENAKLREALAARDAFLAVAAHELRNPMTPIIGGIERLRRMMDNPDLSPAALKKTAERIEWLMARYVRRATTLLDVSRVTMGKLNLDPAQTDISALVREVVDSFTPLAEYAGSELTFSVPERSLIRMGDRLALEQIIDNLVSNAVKYGAGRPIHVAASEDVVTSAILIEVRDSGPGISADNQARIFERFERAVQPGAHGSGFGVGLWIVRQLAEAMGGTVRITSRENEGATFTVALPLQPCKDPQ